MTLLVVAQLLPESAPFKSQDGAASHVSILGHAVTGGDVSWYDARVLHTRILPPHNLSARRPCDKGGSAQQRPRTPTIRAHTSLQNPAQ